MPPDLYGVVNKVHRHKKVTTERSGLSPEGPRKKIFAHLSIMGELAGGPLYVSLPPVSMKISACPLL